VTKEAADQVQRINGEEGVKWIFSFLSADKRKTYCLYEAPNADAILKAARRRRPAPEFISAASVRGIKVSLACAPASGRCKPSVDLAIEPIDNLDRRVSGRRSRPRWQARSNELAHGRNVGQQLPGARVRGQPE